MVIGAVVILAIAGGFYLESAPPNAGHSASANSPSGAPPGATAMSADARTVDAPASGTGPVPLQQIAQGQCRTFAPAGWRVVDSNPQGTVFTLSSADGSMTASYAGTAVGGGQAAGYYGDQFRSPESFALYAIDGMTNEQAQAAGPEQAVGYYQVLNFATASHRGYALLYRFAVPADPSGYGVIMRIAIGTDPRSVSVAGAVAAATRCSAVVMPSRGADYEPPSDEHDTGKAVGDDDSTLAGTYNAQLGTGWVHDGAGNNYNVDVADDYHETGPDGPGYYRQNGNDLIKLQPGLE